MSQKPEPAAPENIRKSLAELTGESSEWPKDGAFRDAWKTKHAYRTLQSPKIVYILRRLNDSYFNAKVERITIHNPLTVEHILPQNWIDNWPLPDGSKGVRDLGLWFAPPDDPRAAATRNRDALLQTFGNLTDRAVRIWPRPQ